MQKHNQPVGILLIATNKYKQFVQPLLDSIDKYFLPDHRVAIYLFTDDIHQRLNFGRMSALLTKIEPYGFPQATLYRYKIFTSEGDMYKGCSHLFYMDVDMQVVAPVGEEILKPVVAVRHPGFYTSGGGSWGNNPQSLSYTEPHLRQHYYAGGFQGGDKDNYWGIMNLLAANISKDEWAGVMAEWHDETHWNKYLTTPAAKNVVGGPLDISRGFAELDPSYCMVEQQHLRQQWGIAHLAPKILALEKKHDEIRS